MKNFKIFLLFITSLLLISCASSLPATETTSQEVDQADTILLEVDQSSDEAYTSFAQHLSSNGFGFENTDETLRVIKTSKKEGKNLSFSYSLDVSIMDTDSTTMIQVNGDAMNPTLGEFQPQKRGMSGSLYMEAWNQMKDVVTSYPHKSVYFKRN